MRKKCIIFVLDVDKFSKFELNWYVVWIISSNNCSKVQTKFHSGIIVCLSLSASNGTITKEDKKCWLLKSLPKEKTCGITPKKPREKAISTGLQDYYIADPTQFEEFRKQESKRKVAKKTSELAAFTNKKNTNFIPSSFFKDYPCCRSAVGPQKTQKLRQAWPVSSTYA